MAAVTYEQALARCMDRGLKERAMLAGRVAEADPTLEPVSIKCADPDPVEAALDTEACLVVALHAAQTLLARAREERRKERRKGLSLVPAPIDPPP